VSDLPELAILSQRRTCGDHCQGIAMKAAPLIALFALAAAACESKPTVSSDVAPTANFASYQTYEWVYQKPPSGMNPINYERIKSAIDGQMSAKGYELAAGGADVAVVFTVGSREKVRVTDMGPYYGGWGGYYRGGYGAYGGGTSVDQYTEGTLAIDLFDAKSKQAVWHGTATQRISDSGADPALIQNAVAATMASLPGRGGAAAAPSP
jgi:hypothetical protein